MKSYSRRVFNKLASGTILAGLLPSAAFALTEKSAGALIGKVVAEINRVIASGKSEAAMIADFKRLFDRYADNAYIAAYALGADARRATATQKRAFSDAFGAYISRRYGRRFREFIGGTVEVKSVKKVKSWYEVVSTANLRGEAPFQVNFLVSDRTGKDLFFNMFIEGVNVLLSERSEIGAMLDRRKGDIDAMIQDLKRAG